MSSGFNATTKRRGRPATGKGTPVQVRLQPEDLHALDRARMDEEEVDTRPEFIRRVLTYWLREKGYYEEKEVNIPRTF
jgi:Ribbon-helix-helix protein, copG family